MQVANLVAVSAAVATFHNILITLITRLWCSANILFYVPHPHCSNMLSFIITSLYAVVPLVVPHTPASAHVAPCSAMALLMTPGGGTGAPAMSAAAK
jgi:hypothetical protein